MLRVGDGFCLIIVDEYAVGIYFIVPQKKIWQATKGPRSVREAAQNYLDTMVSCMAAGVTEELKVRVRIEWLSWMNAIRAQMEEMVRADLIYC